jgi:hypothetical protein
MKNEIMVKLIHIVMFWLIGIFGFAQIVNGQTNVTNEENSFRLNNKVSQSVELNNGLVNPSNQANFSPSFFETESSKLSQEVLFEPTNSVNWGNYYRAERYSHYSKNSNDITTTEQADLDAIVNSMEKFVPQSYEFHFLTYLNGNNNTELVSHLQKAYELNPKSSEVMIQYTSYYEMMGNDAKKKEFCKSLSNTGIYSSGILEFNKNLLNSVEQNAILITHGENDTYPLWIQQNVKSERTDVKVLYIDLLENKEYREKELKDLGLEVTADIKTNKSGFLKELASESKTRSVYFATTVAPELLKPMSANLYITGLAFKYSETSFDNVEVLKKNWNDKLVKEKLNSDDIATGSLESKMNLNYLPGILMLYDNYSKSGNKEAVKLKELALKLGSEGGKEHQVRLYLEK